MHADFRPLSSEWTLRSHNAEFAILTQSATSPPERRGSKQGLAGNRAGLLNLRTQHQRHQASSVHLHHVSHMSNLSPAISLARGAGALARCWRVTTCSASASLRPSELPRCNSLATSGRRDSVRHRSSTPTRIQKGWCARGALARVRLRRPRGGWLSLWRSVCTALLVDGALCSASPARSHMLSCHCT